MVRDDFFSIIVQQFSGDCFIKKTGVLLNRINIILSLQCANVDQCLEYFYFSDPFSEM